MKTILEQCERCMSFIIHGIGRINFCIPIRILIFAVLMTMMASCKKDFLVDSTNLLSGGDANSNLEYYVGAIPNSYYEKDMFGAPGLKVSGKPFMVVKYDRVTHFILDFQFGLSEVTQTVLSRYAFPEPTLDAGSFSYQKKLKLVSPVNSIITWPASEGYHTITNGSLGAGGVIFTYVTPDTKYTFSYLPAGSMTGGAVDLSGEGGKWTDTQSSFNMLRQ